MCGIAGIIRWDGRPALEQEIRGMCRVMGHRGPDDEGVYVNGGVALGMRRLSILDLERGQQPVSNEDGSIWVVFNGEIYNYQDIRRQLERRGHVFRSSGDTETIVHLYEEFGARAVDWLRGMFAFAVWDSRKRQVLLARDRLGIKPLYYVETENELLFASELKPILTLPHVSRSVNWKAASHLFAFLATPPNESIVDGVKKLEPARVGVSRCGSALRIDRYWDVAFDPDERATEGELVERLRALLEESIALHEISDVPIGAFLSGGIDSGAVVATMAKRRSEPVKTFSVGFADARYNELKHARQVAGIFGTDHHEVVLQPDVVQTVDELAWYLDEPFGDASAIPTFAVSRLAAGHVKVVLTGDGGDELFAGYDKYIVEDRERRFDRVPAPLRRVAGMVGRVMPDGARGRRFLRHLALEGPSRYLDASTLFTDDAQRALFHDDICDRLAAYDPWAIPLTHLKSGPDWMSAVQYADLNSYLPLDVLTKVDRMSMAHSIEARPPLLDHRLVEFAATVPTRFRLRDGTTKYLFKRAVRGLLPDAIIDRPKQGFAVPIGEWLRGPLSGFARDILTSKTCRDRGVFKPAAVNRLLRLNERGRDRGLHVWTALSFELWCRRFLDSSGDRAAIRNRVA